MTKLRTYFGIFRCSRLTSKVDVARKAPLTWLRAIERKKQGSLGCPDIGFDTVTKLAEGIGIE
jgi:hypothetical protein